MLTNPVFSSAHTTKAWSHGSVTGMNMGFCSHDPGLSVCDVEVLSQVKYPFMSDLLSLLMRSRQV